MRYKSPERMDQIKVFSEKFYQRYYRKPYISEIAEATNLSKSTVHKDVSDRLLKINPTLAKEVREILDENKAERHLRGGMATKLKYLKEKQS